MLEPAGQKRTDHIKYRNMFVQVLLFIINPGDLRDLLVLCDVWRIRVGER